MFKKKWILLLALTIISHNITYSQQVTLKAKNVTVKQAMDMLKQQSGYSFVFSSSDVDTNRKISISAKKQQLNNVVKQILYGQEVTYEISGQNIIVKKIQTTPSNSTAKQQQTTQPPTKARITDSRGEGIIGATISVKGSKVACVSDIDGNFVINASSKDELIITMVGYKTITISLNKLRKNNHIILEEDITQLDEVVAIGYGTQKKVNLTGSVSSISEKSLDSRPITQASQALAGLSSGVTISLSKGNPGNDGATIRVRGQGTFSSAGSDPLVLIDGISGSIDDVNPNNIKSISVLKDAASASIYGTRAANGVILIETKRGTTGKTQVSYSGYVGWQKATELPDFANSWTYAEMKNEADKNQGFTPTYSNEEIIKFRNNLDPDNYPNVNHLKNLVTSGSGFQTSHNLSFSGGGTNFTYMLSFGYLHQDGIVAQNSYDKYNLLLNIDNNITNRLHLKTNISAYTSVQKEPRSQDNLNTMIGYAVREGSIFAGRKTDGTYGYQDNYCPEGWMDSPSFTNNKTNHFAGDFELEYNPFKNFFISGKGGYKYNNYYNKDYVSELVYDALKKYTPKSLTINSGWNSLVTLQALARYEINISKHNIKILAGVSQEEYKETWSRGYRKGFSNNALYELNAGSTDGQSATGSASEWGLRSVFGRLNYSYSSRYLLELNARYDGTSRFPSNGRWGFFPSASIAWRVSEETLVKEKAPWINNLKLRMSIGTLGNQNVGNYPYQNVISLTKSYPFGNIMSFGGAITTAANSDISWESTRILDFGIDLSILKGKLDLTMDYYNKKTYNILYKIAVSEVLGMTPSENNAASVRNQGFEIALTYYGKIGKVNFSVSPNFSYNKNKVLSLANEAKENINSNLFVGESLGAIYGYEADGLFVDEEDIKSYPTQPYTAEPGFVRYKDISGPNGVPDGKVDATYDRKVIGSTIPSTTFGLTITANYNNFDFSVLFSGQGGNKAIMHNYMAYAFFNSGSIQQWQIDKRWTPENPNRDAEYIKLTTLNINSGTIQPSTFWLRNASFLRLKNLQIGYTLPHSFINRLGLEKVRIYFSGQNLFCINKFYKGWDPEITGNHLDFYPITSVYTFGLNIKI